MGRLYSQYASIEEKLNAIIINNDCWEHQACTNDAGYPLLKYNGKFWYIHRLVYTREFGIIPEGMTVDHICFNTRCIRPDHLQLLSHSDNAKKHRVSQLKKICSRGHEKILKSWGRNVCDICQLERVKKYRARLKGYAPRAGR